MLLNSISFSVSNTYFTGWILNNGYLLAKHEPELAAQLAAQKNNYSEYFKAMVSGKKKFEKEMQAQQWLNSFSKGKPAKEDKNLDKER